MSVADFITKYKKTAILAISLVLLFLKETIGRRLLDAYKGLPPGPIPLPLIGTFYELSPPNVPPGIHEDFIRLSKKYGPIYTLYFGSNKGVVLTKPELWYEALHDKQDETANRPVLKSFEAITHGQGVAMNNGRRWRMIRTLLQTHVTNKQLGMKSGPLISEEVQSSLAHLRETIESGRPVTEDFRQLCRRESLNVIMRKLYSVRFGDNYSAQYYEVQDWIRIIFEHLAQGSPSDFMPLFKYFPNKEEDQYREICVKMENFIDGIIADHRQNFANKHPDDYDFIDSMIKVQNEAKAQNKETLTDIDIRVVCWDSMAGGIDTSATSMEWLVLYLINYPHVQKKLHKLFDEVIGDNRLPTVDDIDKLDYLLAVLDELFRHRHFAPQGLPHEAGKDITLGGYKIPKGTQLFFNYHSPHMDETLWKNPREFRPERFMEEEKELLNVVLHSETFFSKPETYKFTPFGQGRRRCVGYGLGRIVMWLKAALWIHCFEFSSPNNKPMDMDTEYLGITLVPEEQQVKITCRPAARLLQKFNPRDSVKEL